MSDTSVGWRELLVAPLGAEPVPPASLAALLCPAPWGRAPTAAGPVRAVGAEP